MKIAVEHEVYGDLLASAWQLYEQAFEGLNEVAVQRQLMRRDEFVGVLFDARIRKYLAFDGQRLVGLSVFTNDLDAMPLISPRYFQRRWPLHYAERRIWYCDFVALRPALPDGGALALLVEAMLQLAEAEDGIVVASFCRADRGLHRAVRELLATHPTPVRAECVDEQSYWVLRFSGPSRLPAGSAASRGATPPPPWPRTT